MSATGGLMSSFHAEFNLPPPLLEWFTSSFLHSVDLNASVCFTILDELFNAYAVNIIPCVEIDRPYCCLTSLQSAVLRHRLRIANPHQT